MDSEDQEQLGPNTEDEERGDTEPKSNEPQASSQPRGRQGKQGGGKIKKGAPKAKAAAKEGLKKGEKAAGKALQKGAEVAATAITSETGGWGGTAVKIVAYAAKLAKTLRKLEDVGKVIKEGVQGGGNIGKYAAYIGTFLGAFILFFLLILNTTEQGAQANPSDQASALQVIITNGPATAKNGDTLPYTISVSYPLAFNDITLSDQLPVGTQFLSATQKVTCDNGPCDSQSKIVSWSAKDNNLTTNPLNTSFVLTLKAVSVPDNSYLINVITSSLSAAAPGSNASCGQKSTPPAGGLSGYTCTTTNNVNWGTKPMPDNYYYATSFGCSTQFGPDPGDNCIPACNSSAIPECSASGKTGRACEETLKWFAADAGRFGCNTLLRVTNPLTGSAVIVRAIDQGPACSIENKGGRGVVDLSKDAANVLFGSPHAGVVDRKSIQVETVQEGTALGPVNSCAP